MTEQKPPFVHDDAHDSTGFLLWQVTTLWQRRIAAALRPHDLTQVQFVLLAGLLWLGMKEELVTQVMLAKHSKMDAMMTSQVLRALEGRGLIVRSPHPHDSRAKVLKLTAAGKSLVSKALPGVDETDAAFFAGVAETREFNAALRALLPD